MPIYTDPALAATNTLLMVEALSSTGTFITIAEVSNISGMQLSATMKETSTHSNNRPWRKRKPTLLDIGDVTIDLLFVPTEGTHSASAIDGLRKIFKNRELRQYKLVYPDQYTTPDAFDAYISKFAGPDAAVDGLLTAKVTFSGNDQPTLGG